MNKGKSGAGARLSDEMKNKLNMEWIKVACILTRRLVVIILGYW